MNKKAVIEKLPYSKPFLFVDKISELSGDGVRGSFTFSPQLGFYEGHFKDKPVTPGVILTECCAQIGLVCLGIHLMEGMPSDGMMALSSSEMEFYKPVYPAETVEVVSQKIYFRFGKLKCDVEMRDSQKQLICKGTLSGMLKITKNED